jgi:hypothetical protein
MNQEEGRNKGRLERAADKPTMANGEPRTMNDDEREGTGACRVSDPTIRSWREKPASYFFFFGFFVSFFMAVPLLIRPPSDIGARSCAPPQL